MTTYEFDEFRPEELRHLNLALRAFPNVAYGLRAVVSVIGRLSFPVEAAAELREAIGASGVRYGDSAIPVEQLPQLMPDYYFPIESEEDFIAKVADACGRLREPAGQNMPAVVLREATAQRRGAPPDISDDRVLALADIRSGDEARPGSGGLAKRGRG
jgi:hypothetical protein